MKLDYGAGLILDRLLTAGYSSYIVGGAVRDFLLARPINDYDIASQARPDQVKDLFKDYKLVEVGKKFGTIKIIIGSKAYEVTSFRREKSYSDGRRPDFVDFSQSLEEDLARRDFTINAMAFGPEGLVDLFGGKEDLEAGIIRAVGRPETRIKEDYLRALRAIRFACQLDFCLEEDLVETIGKQSENIQLISRERIRDEFSKILLTDKASKGLNLLRQTGLLEEILPELKKSYDFDQRNSHHQDDLFVHSLKVVDQSPRDLIIRLAALFHDMGKVDSFFIGEDGQGHFYGHEKISADLANKALTRLRYDKKTIESVVVLIERHMDANNKYTEKSVRKLVGRLGRKNCLRLFDLQRADRLASSGKENLENIHRALSIYDKIIVDDLLVDTNQLTIDGHDLIDEGFKQGRLIGRILDDITNLVIEGQLKNEKLDILEYVNKEYGEYKWRD